MQFPLRISRHSEPRAVSSRLVEALRKGEPSVSCIGYWRNHHRLDDDVVAGLDHVLAAIDKLVKAGLPGVDGHPYRRPDGERVWIWSWPGEPVGVAFLPRQEPEELRDVEIELQGALPTPSERISQREFG